MKRVLTTVVLLLIFAAPAQADWRWAPPKVKVHLLAATWCETPQCQRHFNTRIRLLRKTKVARYNHRKQLEWNHWTRLYIPDCTWFGESGRGPKYARYRYTLPNSAGSGAYGKFQFKPNTYHANAKYHDWSPLDQEIAVRREFWKHGESPWANC